MAIVITGNDLKIEDIYKVAYGKEKVELHSDALIKMTNCRTFIEQQIRKILLVWE